MVFEDEDERIINSASILDEVTRHPLVGYVTPAPNSPIWRKALKTKE